MKRLAIVLYNLGGPDRLEAVEPFLFNLFMDKAIIDAPLPVRWVLAKFISKRRAPIAQEIYNHIGGKSPILELTNQQARALEQAVGKHLKDVKVQCFICMRYWHPLSPQAVQTVKAFNPDHVIQLPLYPQYSTTTTQSSFADWDQVAQAIGLTVPSNRICCFPTDSGWLAAQADLLKTAYEKAVQDAGGKPVRVLFSAHGLPKKIVEKRGDPYPKQIELGAAQIVQTLKTLGLELTDWLVSYQSRVGRLEWIGPSTEDEIKRAGQEGKALVVLPIAFVSEHSETLVELDIEYKHVATEAGVATYVRVPAVGIHPAFIEGLADMVLLALEQPQNTCPGGGKERLCSSDVTGCPVGIQSNQP